MGRALPELTDELTEWIDRQHLFFVATAPEVGGHVNLSPKGYDSFRVLDPLTVAYVDLTGSGAETIAHVRQNGRVTVMFCAFEGPPQIVRLYGRGEVVLPGDEAWDGLAGRFPELPGVRSIVRVALDRVQSSCGFAVPLMSFEGERGRLKEWAENRSTEELADYQASKNGVSIDGLPALAREA